GFSLVGSGVDLPGASDTSVVLPFAEFPDGIPLDQLNNELPELLMEHGLQFGPESPIRPLAATPEPASVLMLGTGALGLLAYGRRLAKRHRRHESRPAPG